LSSFVELNEVKSTGGNTGAMKRSYWMLIAKVMVGVLLIITIYRIAGAQNLVAVLRTTNSVDFFIACALMGIALTLNGLRWHVVMVTLAYPISMKNSLLGTYESMFFQQTLPAGVGGDIARGVRAFDSGVPARWAIIGVVIDRASGLLFVGFSLLIAAVFARSELLGTPVFHLLVLISAVIATGAATAVLLGTCRPPIWLPAWTDSIVTLLKEYSTCMRSKWFFGWVFFYLVLSNMAYVASFFWCAKALKVDVGWWDAGIIIQGMVLVSIIPISIGGWGLREGAALVLFAPLGIQPTQAVAVSVLLGLVLSVFGLMGAVLWFVSGYRNVSGPQSQNNPEVYEAIDLPIVNDGNP
jgi:glycosyltransferase 2 family protein